MKAFLGSFGAEIALLIGLVAFALWGIPLVPFHPDEASLLYESRDLELLTTDPLGMAWQPGSELSPEMEYRLLNGPLPKYVLGLGRRIAGFGPEDVSVDWDWSKNWEANVSAGALPSHPLLNGARTAGTLAMLAAVALIYFAGRLLRGRALGFAAAFLLGLNALALLHGRRAMAEGTLLLALCLSVIGLLVAHRRPWLAGLTLALAVTSKASTLALVPVGLLASMWSEELSTQTIASIIRRAAWFVLAFVGLSWLLQPVLWRHPVLGLKAMWAERQELVARQMADIQAIAPDHVLPNLPQRAAVLVGNLFVAPLQFAEVGNYLAETQSAEDAYERIFGHNLLRGSAGGGLSLALTLLGVIWGWRAMRRGSSRNRRMLILLLAATIFQGAALVAAIPLPFQRYTLPMLPFLCLWQACGLTGGWTRAGKTTAPPTRGGAGDI
ncbi:MAG TPA: hypothetical protein VFI11_04820 [Anaerolineales bacterium]|nr:hypothetical protein [Anaerolineales bacterium]